MRIPKPILVFLAVRTFLFLSLPIEGLLGYGDLAHFAGWAALEGWPFLDYWMEFPPVFPLAADVLFRLAGGRDHVFYYLLAVVFTLAQAANLALFMRIANIIRPGGGERRAWIYLALLAGLFYGWTYFDPLGVLALLAGLALTLDGRAARAGFVFGLGALVKWFPLLGLAALLRRQTAFSHWKPLAAAAALFLVGWSSLLLASPEFTTASLRSQAAKGSWETVWALVDGNLGTGNFGAKEERYDPARALAPQGNPSVLPPALTLIPFALLGAWAYLRSRLATPKSVVAFTGLTLCLFFLWSPGWSPQWVLYLLPFIFLLLPERRAALFGLTFVLINLLEWPLLLSRGIFQGLYLTVPLRTLLIVLLAAEFWRMIPSGRPHWTGQEPS